MFNYPLGNLRKYNNREAGVVWFHLRAGYAKAGASNLNDMDSRVISSGRTACIASSPLILYSVCNDINTSPIK